MPAARSYFLLCLYGFRASRHLHSFPTRRSSDLTTKGPHHLRTGNHPTFDGEGWGPWALDRKSTRLNSSHLGISYAVFCLKKKNILNSLLHTSVTYTLLLFIL